VWFNAISEAATGSPAALHAINPSGGPSGVPGSLNAFDFWEISNGKELVTGGTF
jgi:hypothetical protein